MSQSGQRLLLTGEVQGVGARPAIARLAHRFQLDGTVCNTAAGVELEIAGAIQNLERFMTALKSQFPSFDIAVEALDLCAASLPSGFQIVESKLSKNISCTIPLDRVVCDDCLKEFRDPHDRRHRYGFIGCSQCGPRYSVLEEMPFDRSRTTMAQFPPCDECLAEYSNPQSRRFHTQLICCPRCGPQFRYQSAAIHIADQEQAIAMAAKILASGKVIGLKGIGGYQLLCDARNESAVRALRNGKGRMWKPLPVMVRGIEEATNLAHLNERELAGLMSHAGPIVLAVARSESPLAANVHEGVADIGLMLPTTPLHAWIAEAVDGPLIVTSGNREGEPIIYDVELAEERLSKIVTGFIHHNRPIARPIDDSVMRDIAGRMVTLRAGRGIAPLRLASLASHPYVAVGGHQKSAVTLDNGRFAALFPHIGDLDSIGTRERYEEQVSRAKQLVQQTHPACYTRDSHPTYYSSVAVTRWSSHEPGATIHSIQHHHAHALSAMYEHHLLDQEVLAFTFDGTGYGDDGTIWGGEVLLVNGLKYRRIATLVPFPLVGGEIAIRQPWRVAVAFMTASLGDTPPGFAERFDVNPATLEAVKSILLDGTLTPTASSMGRLFDGVAAIVLGLRLSQREGEPAMRLEAVCDLEAEGAYKFEVTTGSPLLIDWRPLIREVFADCEAKVAVGTMAMKFHRAVANLIRSLAEMYDTFPIVFSGGVFQNRVLGNLLADLPNGRRGKVGFPEHIPPNDGGLAVGQWAAFTLGGTA